MDVFNWFKEFFWLEPLYGILNVLLLFSRMIP